VCHALLTIDEDRLDLDGHVLFQYHTLILQVLEGVIGLVELLLKGIESPRQFVTFTDKTAEKNTSKR
jgi:hypothetical protein